MSCRRIFDEPDHRCPECDGVRRQETLLRSARVPVAPDLWPAIRRKTGLSWLPLATAAAILVVAFSWAFRASDPAPVRTTLQIRTVDAPPEVARSLRGVVPTYEDSGETTAMADLLIPRGGRR